MSELAARLEILERVSDLGLGLDLPDPNRYRRCFADVVEVDNPAFGRVDRYTGDEWAKSVSRTQARLISCVHTLTSPSIEVHGARADVILMQQAHFAGMAGSYRVAGPLRLKFEHTARGWRIARLDFQVRWSDGDPEVYERARKGGT